MSSFAEQLEELRSPSSSPKENQPLGSAAGAAWSQASAARDPLRPLAANVDEDISAREKKPLSLKGKTASIDSSRPRKRRKRRTLLGEIEDDSTVGGENDTRIADVDVQSRDSHERDEEESSRSQIEELEEEIAANGSFSTKKNKGNSEQEKGDRSNEILEKLEQLMSASQRKVLSEKAEKEKLLKDLESRGRSHGFENEALVRIVRLLGLKGCQKPEQVRAVSSLFPKEPVSAAVVEELMGGFHRFSSKVKNLALKWLIIVHRRLSREATHALRSCYGVFFHFIDFETNRPLICRILYMLTQRKDVTRFRTEKLQSVIKDLVDTGQDAGPLLLLADLYAQYAPESIPSFSSRFSRPRVGFFRSPDETWASQIGRISSGMEKKRIDASASNKAATSTAFHGKKDFVALAEVKSSHELGEKLVRGVLSFPDKCSEILEDSMFQYWICAMPDEEKIVRLRQTLPYLVEEEFFEVEAVQEPSENLLRRNLVKLQEKSEEQLERQSMLFKAMADFSDFMQQTIPELEHFVLRYLETWNGVHHLENLLRLVARLQPRSTEDMQREILEPLDRLFRVGDVHFKVKIANCLCELVRNWAEIDWESHSDSKSTAFGEHRFVPLPRGVDFYIAMFELVGFVDHLLLIALITEKDHPLLQVQVNSFYVMVSGFHTERKLPFVAPPSPGLVYRMLLSDTLIGPSLMAEVLVSFKASVQSLHEKRNAFQQTNPNQAANAAGKIRLFNSYWLDYCCMLWLDNPMPEGDASLLLKDARRTGLLEEVSERGMSRNEFAKVFSITDSLPFAGVAASSESDLTSEKGKCEFLEELKRKHCTGLVRFLKSFVTSLSNA